MLNGVALFTGMYKIASFCLSLTGVQSEQKQAGGEQYVEQLRRRQRLEMKRRLVSDAMDTARGEQRGPVRG